MAEEQLTPVDLGFAEFVSKLIADVFDATISSQAQQLEKLIELESLLARSNDEFIDALLARDEFFNDIELLLTAYFPLDDGEHAHAIYEGAPYEPAKNDTLEQPPIAEKLGLVLSDGDFKPRAKVLTLQGVTKIYRKAAEPFAAQRRLILKQLVENGLPKLVVDSGKINAKLTFTTHKINDSDEASQGEATTGDVNADASRKSAASRKSSSSPTGASSVANSNFRKSIVSSNTQLINERLNISTLSLNNRLTLPIQPINRYVGLIKPNLNDQVRLTVKPASNQTPQDTQVTTNIYSEVEIHFKTIV
jgi:hypothetical protein